MQLHAAVGSSEASSWYPSVSSLCTDFGRCSTARGSAGRQWQGELCARRCGEGGGKRGKEGDERDKWRRRDGGRWVGSTFCSLLPCELQPELPLVFSLTYFLRPTSPSYLMQGFSIFPALFALEELQPQWASGSCLQARLSLLHPSPGILPSPRRSWGVRGVSGRSEYPGQTHTLAQAPL